MRYEQWDSAPQIRPAAGLIKPGWERSSSQSHRHDGFLWFPVAHDMWNSCSYLGATW